MLERLEAFREEAELAVELPAFEEIERRGWSRRRRRQAVIGTVVASVLAATAFLATQGAETRPQPAEDVERTSSAMSYPINKMVTLAAGTYEVAPSPDGLRPAARFTLPPGWNAGQLPDRFEGLGDRVTYDPGVNKRLLRKNPDWYVGMILWDVEWVAQRGCSDMVVTDAASLVVALTHIPGLQVTSIPESTVRFGHPAVHLQLRERGSQAGPCRRESILSSTSYGYLTHQERGTTYDAWVIDLPHRPVLAAATWAPGSPRAEVDSLFGILASVELLEPE
jgi:hypothetical protein